MNNYERTIQLIQNLVKVPSAKEWNKFAGKYAYLSTKTLRVVTGMNFADLCKTIRKRS